MSFHIYLDKERVSECVHQIVDSGGLDASRIGKAEALTESNWIVSKELDPFRVHRVLRQARFVDVHRGNGASIAHGLAHEAHRLPQEPQIEKSSPQGLPVGVIW